MAGLNNTIIASKDLGEWSQIIKITFCEIGWEKYKNILTLFNWNKNVDIMENILYLPIRGTDRISYKTNFTKEQIF